jgi:hypothetical protein
MIETGYFANTKKWTKVHVTNDRIPICGSKINKDKSFQLCANGIVKNYVECEKCKTKLINFLK